MIKDIFKKRKHVAIYDEEIVPTEAEIKEILKTAYPLVTSKQKAFPYQVNVLGPNKQRSIELWNLCEGNKIDTDIKEFGPDQSKYSPNEGLFHIYNAPYTLIITPREAPPNEYHKEKFAKSNSKWELHDRNFVNTANRESGAIEIGMIAKVITGLLLEKGWDTSYNVCFPKDLLKWKDYTFLKFVPTLIQTIGKGKKYKYEYKEPGEAEKDIAPPFDDIFKFVDNN